MKKTAFAVMLSLLAFIAPTQALFEDDAETTLVISGFIGTPGDEEVSLEWSASPDKNGNDASSFKVYSSKTSVAEGLANEYEDVIEVTEASATISNLTNGSPVYVAVQAIGQNDIEGEISEELRLVPSVEGADVEAPTVTASSARTKESVAVEFSKNILLPEENPELSFTITEADDDSKFLLVWSAEYDVQNKGEENEEEVHYRVILQTDEQVADKDYKVTVSALITDEDGNPIESGATDSAVFTGTDKETFEEDHPVAGEGEVEPEADDNEGDETEGGILDNIISPEVGDTGLTGNEDETAIAPVDTEAPADVTNFMISFKARASDFLVKLSWTLSADTASEIVDQILYHSLDKGTTWDAGKLLAQTDTDYELSAKPETEHTFKLTTRDQAGNESDGVIRSVRLPALPQTGPVALVALGAGLALAGVSRLRKK